MRRQLRERIEELRELNLEFDSEDMERFLRRYAIARIKSESLEVTSEQVPYMNFLMKRKLGDMIARARVKYNPYEKTPVFLENLSDKEFVSQVVVLERNYRCP